MNLLRTSLLALVMIVSFTSCSKEEEVIVEELNYSIDLNLANETDWDMANEILRLVNDHRVSLGLPELIKDRQYASAYAVEHTQYMIETRDVSHENFSERVRALKDRGAAAVGENVGYGYTKASTLVTAWLNSPSHKRVLEGNYTHCGFGVMQNAQGHYYFTQIFYRK